jgi:hypothetical protein
MSRNYDEILVNFTYVTKETIKYIIMGALYEN